MENRLFIKNTTKNRKELENMTFKYESDFEETLINLLSNKGWEKDVIKYPTESNLLLPLPVINQAFHLKKLF